MVHKAEVVPKEKNGTGFAPKFTDYDMLNSSRPLDNFPLVRTRRIDDAQDALARVYARPSLQLAHGYAAINASINNCQLQNIGLAYGAFGAAVGLEFPPANFFVQFFPIQGSGEIVSGTTKLTLTDSHGATISPGTGFNAAYGANYQYLALRIEARALTRKLAGITGATISEPLRMNPRQNPIRPTAQLLYRYLPTLVRTLSVAQPPFPDWWIAQTEQLLMTLFLCGYEHNYSHLFEAKAPDAATWQVRRAEEYIEANWQQAITLEDLAGVTGVSAFSLFRSFKLSRGCSPLAFASQVRSRHKDLRKDLQ